MKSVCLANLRYLVGLVLLLSIFCSCSAPSDEAAPDTIELTFWHGIESRHSSGILQEKINAFQTRHPHIKIRLHHYGAADQVQGKIMTALAGKHPPDLMWWGPQATGRLARSGALMDLQERADSDPEFPGDQIYPVLWNSCRYQGRLRAVPFDANNLALYYNKRHFEKQNIDPHAIATWAQLLGAARKLTLDTDGDGVIDRYGFQIPLGKGEWTVWTWQTFLWQAGGELLDASHQHALFDSQAAVEALQFWVDLVHKHKVAKFSEPDAGYKLDDFLAGRISMMINGPWNLHLLEAARKDQNLAYGAIALPVLRRQATNIGGENLFLFRSNPVKENAAWTFAKYILSVDFQVDWAIQTGYLPVNRKALDDARYQRFLAQHAFMQVFANQMPFGRQRPAIPAYTKISAKLGQMIERALYQKIAPAEALKQAAVYANGVLAKSDRTP